jgi:hypothetical protein
MRPRLLSLALFAAAVIGAWLRLDQLPAQVLIEDEWHTVHQLIYYPLGHILLSFGNADYSIPLTLLAYVEANTIGLTEFGLRLPMVIAGIATVALLPLMFRERMDARVVGLFALLLAISPFLVSYSRIARPYAITLLGIYIACWLFQATMREDRLRWPAVAGYALVCGLVVWTHLAAGPVLVAPLVAAWLAWLLKRGGSFAGLVAVTVATGASMALAVMPPLVSDPGALSGKSAMDAVTMDTVVGAWHLFTGTGSSIAAAIALALGIVGFTAAWKSSPIVRWIGLGIVFTAGLLAVTQPWWVDKPLALARYSLPALPIALLAISAGIVKAGDAIASRLPPKVNATAWGMTGVVLLLAAWVTTTPYSETLRRPNSYTQHSYFQFDYREAANPVRSDLSHPEHPSPFWADLRRHRKGSITVAVAPFRYATYEWPAPRWELESRQRVIPAYAWGWCAKSRYGEVPIHDARFRLENAVHLGEPKEWPAHGVDYVAYYKGPVTETSAPVPLCEEQMRKWWGPPVRDDAELVVWKVR